MTTYAGTIPNAEVVYLEDSGGDVMEVIPGILDDETEWVYLNGQCLAMGVALSEILGNEVLVHTFTEQDDDLDEDGEPLMFTSVRHIYALAADGGAWDIRGEHDPTAFEVDENEALVTMSSDEAQGRFYGFLCEQNYEVARVFASVVMRRAREGRGEQ